jgi:hypothetical protein
MYSSRFVTTFGVLAITLAQPGLAQVAREVEPIVLTGSSIPDWSRLPATTVCAAYPSGTTGGRDAHNGTQVVPPDARVGAPVDEIVAYRWTGLAFVEIPVQVDQRFNYCLSNPPSGFSFYSGTDKELTYAWDSENWKKTDGECSAAYPPGVQPTADPVATLDDDDEIVFMASDAGLQAPLGVIAPAGTSEGHAIAIVDPLDLANLKYVYLYRKPGGSSFNASNGYVSYERDADADEWIDRYSIAADDPETLGVSNTDYGPNLPGTVCRTASYPGYPAVADGTPRASTDRFVRDGVTVETDTYQWRATGRWMVREIHIAKPGQPGVYGPDLIDRWKGRAFQQSPDSTISLVGFEDEQVNWEANSALLGERVGPVRAIRETWGADSGTNVTKTETFYRDAITYRYHVRVHPIPPDGLYTSWDYSAGGIVGTYYNTIKSEGVPIDGQNDDVGSIDGVFGMPAYFDVPDPTFNAPSAILNWEQVAGALDFGSLVYIVELKGATTLVNPAVVPYYRDDTCLDDGTGDDPVARPWPGEPSTDQRVIDGYEAANGGTPYEQLTCHQRQGAWGSHGIHYFVTGDSDNAASPEVLTEIDAQQWQFLVPLAAPANVGQTYANTVIARLITSALPLDSIGILPPTAASSAEVTDFEVPLRAVLSGNDLDGCELTFTIITPPEHGQLGAISNAACSPGLPSSDQATVIYTPALDYSGTDSFVYQVTDASDQTATATVAITVLPKSPPTCAIGPLPICEAPGQAGGSMLRITEGAVESGDRLTWTWQRGSGEFGDPTTGTDYELCVFDASGDTIAHVSVPARGQCNGRPCWRGTTTGFQYRKGRGSSSMRLSLRSRGVDNTRIKLSGRGAQLRLDPLPAEQPVRVQLQNSDGGCWEAVYSAPALRNHGSRFRDRSDP